MEQIITVENLVKRYKKAAKNAVDNISLLVEQGEFFCLLGPNGAGKTTAISILTTTLQKTSGEVRIAGYNLDKNPSEVRQSIGVIFQNQSLDLNLTAEENVRMHAILYGLYPWRPAFSFMPHSYKERVHTLASVLGIENELAKPVKTFSGGMKRKLEIVRSLMHNPKVLFLDEPTSGLDPVSRRNLWEYLREVRRKENTTIFLTTHYLEEAEEADHITIINHGKVVSSGTPAKIKERLVKRYIVVDAKDRNQLILDLTKLNLSFTKEPPFKVQTKNVDIQHIIASISIPLSRIEIHEPSIEEAYLKIIENHEGD